MTILRTQGIYMSFSSKLLCVVIFFGVAKIKCMEEVSELQMKLRVRCELNYADLDSLKSIGITVQTDGSGTFKPLPREVSFVETPETSSSSITTYEYVVSIKLNEYIIGRLFETEIFANIAKPSQHDTQIQTDQSKSNKPESQSVENNALSYSNVSFALFPKYETVDAALIKSGNIEKFLKAFYYESLKCDRANAIVRVLDRNLNNGQPAYLSEVSIQRWQQIFNMAGGEKRANRTIDLSTQILNIMGTSIAIIELVGFLTFDARKAHDASFFIFFFGVAMAWLCKD